MGTTQKELIHKGETSPAFLLDIAYKYLSRYMQRQIEKELTPVEELLRNIVVQDTKITLDFEDLDSNDNAKDFIASCSVRYAALMLADIFDGRIIYNAAKNDKNFYFFNDHIWENVSDVMGIIHDALRLVVRHFLRLNKDSDIDDEAKKKNKNRMIDILRKINSRTFRTDIKNELSGLKKEGVYHNSDDINDPLHFDGEIIKETLTLADGVLDFSGKELIFRKSRPEEFRRRTLDYKIEDVKKGGPCEKIWKFMRGNFKNDDTLQTLMYYLSIIPSRTHYKYGGFWIGGKNTGKSTTARIIRAVYQHLICSLDKNLIVPKGKVFANADAPSPQLARLPGCGAAFVNEPEDGAWLNVGRWKELTGGDVTVARGLNEAPKEFVNTAQIIINTNHLPKFDRHDEAVIVRAVVIPFLVSHQSSEEGTMQPDEFVKHLQPEFPAFIRLLAEYYIRFKHELNSVLPISGESEAHKMGYIEEVESDLDRFVKICVIFDPQATVVIKDAYEHYMSYYGFDEAAVKRKEAISHPTFTRRIMKNYKDMITERMVRVNRDGESKPIRCFAGMRLKSFDEISERPQARGASDNHVDHDDNEGEPF